MVGNRYINIGIEINLKINDDRGRDRFTELLR